MMQSYQSITPASMLQPSLAQAADFQVNPVCQKLAGVRCLDLAPEKQRIERMVASVQSNERLIDAVRLLTERRLAAVPVIKEDADEVIGMLSLDDIATYLTQKVLPELPQVGAFNYDRPLAEFIAEEATVKNVVDFSVCNPLEIVRDTESGAVAATLMSGGLQRVLVVDDARKIRATVTAADVIRWIHAYRNLPEFERLLNKTLLSLSFNPQPLKTVSASENVRTVLETFRGNVLAVVDETSVSQQGSYPTGMKRGKLVGSFSCRELKNVLASGGPRMSANVGDVLQVNSPTYLKPRVMKIHSSLRDILVEMVNWKQHEVWLADEQGVPLGAFTQNDFLAAVVNTKTSNPICHFLSTLPAFSLAPEIQSVDKRVIALRSTDHLADAVAVLANHKILCAPVINEEIPQVIGLLALEDVAAYVAQKTAALAIQSDNDPKYNTLASYIVRDALVQNLVDFSGRNPMEMLRYNDSALMALQVLGGGLHRVILLDEEKRVKAMITQADIIRCLHKNWDREDFKEMMFKKLTDVGILPKPVHTITRSDSLRHALDAFRTHGCGGLAVVDEAGKLVGNFSCSDFKLLFASGDTAPRLDMTVGDFLSQYTPRSLSPASVSLGWTMRDLTRMFAETRFHHFWLTDGDNRPTGVVSQTDFVRALAETNF